MYNIRPIKKKDILKFGLSENFKNHCNFENLSQNKTSIFIVENKNESNIEGLIIITFNNRNIYIENFVINYNLQKKSIDKNLLNFIIELAINKGINKIKAKLNTSYNSLLKNMGFKIGSSYLELDLQDI